MAGRPKKASGRGASHSGAVGGSSTFAGLIYQVTYAAVQALELIGRVLADPLLDPMIQVESRSLESSTVTAWDVSFSHPNTTVEAKLNPTRQDIIEWLDRVRIGATQSDQRRFILLYARGTPTLLQSLRHLIRIAKEAGGDPVAFQDLLDIEHIEDADDILGWLGQTPVRALQRLEIRLFDEASLDHDLHVRLQYLAGKRGSDRVRDLLLARFQRAGRDRTAFRIRDIVSEIEAHGIELLRPPIVEPEGLPPEVHATLFVLQSCTSGLPVVVLAEGIGIAPREMESLLERCKSEGWVGSEGDRWALNPLVSRLTHSQGVDLLSRTLVSLLEFIRANQRNFEGPRQVHNSLALCRACETQRPEVVARTFLTLDKPLKRLGNKRLVLEAARMAVDAAGRAVRTKDILEGEAQARICGLSWVYQRVDDLELAATEAHKSLEQGQSIGWGRNTAFCYKCIGRLWRMKAEQNSNSSSRDSCIKKSIESLENAIQEFTTLPEFGPESDEVADCQSLLARTYLVAGSLVQSQDFARRAVSSFTDHGSKDWMDLLILLGEIEAAQHHFEDAERYFTEALNLIDPEDAERSEIAARAWFRRGLVRIQMHVPNRSREDLQKAVQAWEALEEEAVAEAKWQLLLLEQKIDAVDEKHLRSLAPPIRVEAVRLALAQGSRPDVVGRRAKRSANLWEHLAAEATRNVAIRRRYW